MRVSDVRDLRRVRRVRKADDNKIAAMHTQKRAGVVRDGIRVIGSVCAIRRSNLDQDRPALSENVRDSEPASDFHGLAARNDNLTSRCNRREGKKHCGSVVVDDNRGLSARQESQQQLGMRVAGATFACLQVVFKIRVTARHFRHRRDGGLAQGRPSQVRVDNDTGRIDDATGPRPE